jgi:peptide/nickel transport system permease protein
MTSAVVVMTRFVVRRVAQAIPLLLIVSVLVFALIHAAPVGPLALYLDNPQRPARRTSSVCERRWVSTARSSRNT